MRKLNIITWSARILSIVSVGVILMFIIGEGFNPALIKLNEWMGLFFFPFGVSVGMILAWRKEGLGGSITIGSFLLFYAAHFITSRRFPSGWAFFVFAFPGILFLLSWYQKKKISKPAVHKN